MVNRMQIFKEIAEERVRQDETWGEQNHSCLNQTLINTQRSPSRMCQEYEIPSETRAKFLCKTAFSRGEGTFAHIAVEELSEAISAFNVNERRKKLVQLAAVVVSWIEKIDRENTKTGHNFVEPVF